MKYRSIALSTRALAFLTPSILLSSLPSNVQSVPKQEEALPARGSKITKTEKGKNGVPSTGIVRRPLITAPVVGNKTINRVEATEIRFPAYQKAPRHSHPCPVVGRVTEGQILFQIEGQPARLLRAGEAFFEPANAVILHFDNATAKPATFTAYYLLGSEDHELITPLPAAQKQ